MVNFLYPRSLFNVQDYTFLYNERNSNSNRRFRFGSNINGIRFYANITDLPKPNIPTRKSFSLVFQDCDIFDKKLFESYLLNYLNPDTWYIVVAYLNYSDSDSDYYKNLHTNHFIHPSNHFYPEDKAKIGILYTWLSISREIDRLEESYNIQNIMINHVTVYFSVIDDSISENWLSRN